MNRGFIPPTQYANLGLASQNVINQGNQVTISFGETDKGVLKADVPNCSGPQYATIALTYKLLTTLATAIPPEQDEWPDLFATISFGAGGFQNKVFVDWREGALISVPATCIDIKASWFFPSPIGVAPSPTVISQMQALVGAMVSYTGVKPATQATRTLRLFSDQDNTTVIAAGDTGRLGLPPTAAGRPPNHIPPYATSYRVLLCEAAGGTGGANEYPNVTVTQLTSDSRQIGKAFATLDPILLNPSCNLMNAENASALDLLASVQFDLAV